MTSLITLRDPKHVTDLASSGILVNVMMTSSTMTVRDKQASDQLADDKSAAHNSVDVTKRLCANINEFRLLQNHRQTVYNGLETMTFEFANPTRYLPNYNIDKFRTWFDIMVAQHATLKDAFLTAYAAKRSDALFALGDLGNLDDFPTVDELEKRFTLRCVYLPVPQSHFFNQTAHAAVEDAKQSLQGYLDEQVNEIFAKQIEQVSQVLKSISHCCTVETVDEGGVMKIKRRKLYDSTIQKGLDLCDAFDKFNPTGSMVLPEIRRMLAATLGGVSVDTLRESDSLRVAVKQGVDEIINKYSL